MRKFLVCSIILATLSLQGCGYFSRASASLTGGATQSCIDGVTYLQFTSGATVMYNQGGTVRNCK